MLIEATHASGTILFHSCHKNWCLGSVLWRNLTNTGLVKALQCKRKESMLHLQLDDSKAAAFNILFAPMFVSSNT